jgi:hypothetical protein
MIQPFTELLRFGLWGVILLAEVVGLIVCCRNLRLSSWVKMVAAGFGLLLLAGAWHWGGLVAMRVLGMEFPAAEQLFLFGALSQGAGWLLVAFGLAATFHDVSRRLERYRIEILRLSGDQPPPG